MLQGRLEHVSLMSAVKKRAFHFPEKETIATSPEIFMSNVVLLLHKISFTT